VRILPGTGKISRIADISASQGHVVPTALALHDGAFYLGNLGTFPITTGAERLFRIERDGDVRIVRGNLTRDSSCPRRCGSGLMVGCTSRTKDSGRHSPGKFCGWTCPVLRRHRWRSLRISALC
jgi:hypothetical protein